MPEDNIFEEACLPGTHANDLNTVLTPSRESMPSLLGNLLAELATNDPSQLSWQSILCFLLLMATVVYTIGQLAQRMLKREPGISIQEAQDRQIVVDTSISESVDKLKDLIKKVSNPDFSAELNKICNFIENTVMRDLRSPINLGMSAIPMHTEGFTATFVDAGEIPISSQNSMQSVYSTFSRTDESVLCILSKKILDSYMAEHTRRLKWSHNFLKEHCHLPEKEAALLPVDSEMKNVNTEAKEMSCDYADLVDAAKQLDEAEPLKKVISFNQKSWSKTLTFFKQKVCQNEDLTKPVCSVGEEQIRKKGEYYACKSITALTDFLPQEVEEARNFFTKL